MALDPDGPGIVRANRPGNPRTQFDHLPFFGGETVGNVASDEIARALIARNVPGISHTNGREANLSAYSQHLEKLGKAAADRAVNDWIHLMKI